MARRASYIKSVQEEQSKNVLVLDAGNVFSSPGVQGKIKAESALEGMQMMSYRLFNLGHTDFVHGLDFLLDTSRHFSLQTLTANVVYEDTGEPITAPHALINLGMVKVGFIGVLAKSRENELAAATSDHPRALAVLDEKTTLQKEITAVGNRADLIVVLASVGLEKSIEIAREIEGIDLIVCSGGKEIEDSYFINGTYIVKAGYDGKHIGRVTLDLSAMKNVVSFDSTVVELDSSFPDDENLKALLDEYHSRLEDELKDELRTRKQEDPDTGWYYAGSDACTGCHPDQSAQWSTTRHAEAFSSLTESDQGYNPECIFCHATGWGYTGGFVLADDTPAMENVQCEMCHGAAGEHIETGRADFETASASTCLQCHTEENSPEFNYDLYYELIKH